MVEGGDGGWRGGRWRNRAGGGDLGVGTRRNKKETQEIRKWMKKRSKK